MSGELLTVIIPIYNVQDYLDECLASIAKQSFRKYTVILVDDGSTDESGKICDQWVKKDHRFQVIHKQNGGVSSARNEGLRHVNTKYTIFIDPDDYISQEMFEQMITVAEKEQADMVVCQFYDVMPNGEMCKHYDSTKDIAHLNRKEYLALLAEDREITDHFWRRIFRTDKIKDFSFALNMNFEDTHAIVNASENCQKVISLNKGLYYYRHNPNGIVRNATISNFVDRYKAVEEKYKKINALEPILISKSDSWFSTKLVDIYCDMLRVNMVEPGSKDLKIQLRKRLSQYPLNEVQGKIKRKFAWVMLNLTILDGTVYKVLHSFKPNAV